MLSAEGIPTNCTLIFSANYVDIDRQIIVASVHDSIDVTDCTLAGAAFFPESDLPTLRRTDSYLQGYPNMNTWICPPAAWARASVRPAVWPRWPSIRVRICGSTPC